MKVHGVLGVEAGDEFGLGLRQIEGHAVGLRDCGGEEAEEAEDLGPDIPPRNPPFGVLRLRVDDVAQIEAPRHQQHADDGQGE